MHREIEEVTWRSPQLVDQLLEVWERSVRATHRFLSADGIAEIKLYVPQALREVPHLVAAWRENGTPAGFMGVDGQKLEMLFLAPEERDTEYIMLALRTREGLDGPTFQRRYRQRFEPLARALAPMAAAGLAEETAPGRWRLTPRGFLVSNAVIRRLWEALEEEKLRRAEAKARGDYRIL